MSAAAARPAGAAASPSHSHQQQRSHRPRARPGLPRHTDGRYGDRRPRRSWRRVEVCLAVDVQDLFEDQRRLPVPRLAPGRSVYRRPRMAEEGVPENAELV